MATQAKCGFCGERLTRPVVELVTNITYGIGDNINLAPGLASLSCPSCKAVLGTTILQQ